VKILSGAELVGFIKERQAHQVRGLRQAWHAVPKLLILRDNDDPVISRYVGLKKRYGEEIGVEVVDQVLRGSTLQEEIERANIDNSVCGIIVQLPLQGSTLQSLQSIAPEKDVDGLGDVERVADEADEPVELGLAASSAGSEASSAKAPVWPFTSATAEAIDWLLAGYNVELRGKRIAIVGQGKLVGAPLLKLWRAAGYNVTGFDINDAEKLPIQLPSYDVIVSATGKPGLLKSEMVREGAVVVDAGTASDKGAIKGDASDDLRARRDITITPKIGGVGPLTVAVLFDHVIRATIDKTKKV
jgi:methylenetetrahydrofolate dehydrogenase (NADP+)/methenyltetrahydrofolate cyclohydrolase